MLEAQLKYSLVGLLQTVQGIKLGEIAIKQNIKTIDYF
jgi:hypothetical protein